MSDRLRPHPQGIGYLFAPIVIALVLIVFAGCATQGGPRSISEDGSGAEGNRVLILPLFENETFEPILERPLTQIFKETLFERGWVVARPGQGPGRVLRGRITSFGLHPLSLNPVGAAREYRIEIGMTLVLLAEDGGTEERRLTVQGAADYLARPDPVGDRLAKDRAIREAGRGMAEKIAAALDAAHDPKFRGRDSLIKERDPLIKEIEK